MSLLEFFILTFTFGPAAAVPYGLTFIDPGVIFVTLLFCYTIPVPVILYILTAFEQKEDYKNRIINEAVFLTKKQLFELRKISDSVTKVFYDWWGDLGYDIALAFLSFVLGFLWGTFLAFLMRLPKTRAYIAVFFGNLFGLIFWFAVAIGTIKIVDSSFFVIFFLFVSLYSYLYGKAREKRILPIIVEMIRKSRKKVHKKKK
jgi:uncharacterized membrane protein